MRIVFFGTPAFAVPSLQALAEAGHAIVGVVTQPDRPRGRGQHLQPSEVKVAAQALGVPVLQPTKLKDPGFADELKTLGADLGVVAAYGRILPAGILATPALGMINVHASLLPRWRGAAPVHRAIIAGDQETGVTIMRVVGQLDAGPMLAKVVTPIGPDETSPDLENRLAALGAALLVKTAAELPAGRVRDEPQDESLVTYAAKLEKIEGALDWNQPAPVLHNRIRGLQPWPMASAMFQGKRIILRRSEVGTDDAHQSPPGTVIRADQQGIVVAASHGAVRLLEVQLEGRPPVTAEAFLNGHAVRPGDRFEPLPVRTT